MRYVNDRIGRQCHRTASASGLIPDVPVHERSLPLFATLGAYLPIWKATVRAPVSIRLEITEIHRRVISVGGMALRLMHPLDLRGVLSGLPVVANLLGTTDSVAWGLGTDIEGLAALGDLLAWMRSPQLPVQTCRPDDAGSFIAWPLAITRLRAETILVSTI